MFSMLQPGLDDSVACTAGAKLQCVTARANGVVGVSYEGAGVYLSWHNWEVEHKPA